MTPAEVKARVAEQVRARESVAPLEFVPKGRRSRLGRLVDGTPWWAVRPLLDLAALALTIALAIAWPQGRIGAGSIWALLLMAPLAMALLAARGMYARRLRATVLDSVVPVGGAVSIAVLGVALADVYLGSARLEPPVFIHLWTLGLALVGLERTFVLFVEQVARVRGLAGHRALIVGAGYIGARIARRLDEQPEYGLHPVGFLDADPLNASVPETDVPILGTPADLEWIAQLTEADHVVLAFSAQPDEQLVELVRDCERIGLEVLLVPRLFDSLNHRASYEHLGGLPLQRLRSISPRGWQFAVKHASDRIVAALLLAVLAPLLLLIGILVKCTSRGPILFRQQRVGRDGRDFHLLKFRSMRRPLAPRRFEPSRGTAPGGVEGQDRRTAVGRVLRRLSLDELPQLINVLRGEMSLVGPRPERPEFVELFLTDIDRYSDRHRVKSGITGWAQVHGLRGQTSLADRVEWDNFYIEHWSLGLDLKVLALTLVAIFRAAE